MHAKEIMMADNKDQDAAGGSTSGPYTGGAGAGITRESGIIHASPESNVGPPGMAQNSHGFAGEPTPPPGTGTQGGPENSQLGMGAAAIHGDAATSADDDSEMGDVNAADQDPTIPGAAGRGDNQ
jgi:hypothetical protein